MHMAQTMIAILGLVSGKTVMLYKMSHSTGALAEQGLKDKLEDSEMQRVP